MAKHHMPDAMKKLEEGQKVVTAVAGFGRAINGIHASFYNETIAAQAAKRRRIT